MSDTFILYMYGAVITGWIIFGAMLISEARKKGNT